MSIFDDALGVIDQNRNNKFNCIPYDKKLPRFSEYLPGIEQKQYYLIAGASGAGKSQLTDDLFLFTPYDFILEEDNDLEVEYHYYSLEMSKVTKMHQWMARRLFTHYGIRSSIKILQSVGKNRLNDNLWMAVNETRCYFEKLEGVLTMHEGMVTPSRVIRDLESYARKNGKVITETVVQGNGATEQRFVKYVPNNPKKYVIIILDHFSLLTCQNGSSIKQSIEELSRYFVLARNRYNFTLVPIQQLSAEGENLEHVKSSRLMPSKDVLGESKLTYNDCDVALGISNPQKYDIKTDRGYNIGEMKDAYRSINIFKGRYSVSNLGVGLYFDGAVDYFKELPRSDQINSSHYEMIKNRKPNW